jgi:hypothetical protein
MLDVQLGADEFVIKTRSLFVQVTHIYSLGEEVGGNLQCLGIK